MAKAAEVGRMATAHGAAAELLPAAAGVDAAVTQDVVATTKLVAVFWPRSWML